MPPPGLAATVPVAELLTQTPELLAAYETPSTLEHAATATEALPETNAHETVPACETDGAEAAAAATRGPAATGPSAPAVRACSRLPPEELPRALEALDESGMLAAVRRGSTSARCGLFCVRKEWCSKRRVWILRLILDRRPRNAEEKQIMPDEDTMPHGCLFCEIILEHGEDVRLWMSDLPQ